MDMTALHTVAIERLVCTTVEILPLFTWIMPGSQLYMVSNYAKSSSHYKTISPFQVFMFLK